MNTESKTLKIAPEHPSFEAIRKAASAIRGGGIIAYPTRCLYGLGVDAFDKEALQRLYSIKKRSARKPILVLIEQIRQLDRLVTRVTGIASQIMRLFWPGKITLVFEAAASVPTELTGGSIVIHKGGKKLLAEQMSGLSQTTSLTQSVLDSAEL